jgi:hypothetical protein
MASLYLVDIANDPLDSGSAIWHQMHVLPESRQSSPGATLEPYDVMRRASIRLDARGAHNSYLLPSRHTSKFLIIPNLSQIGMHCQASLSICSLPWCEEGVIQPSITPVRYMISMVWSSD